MNDNDILNEIYLSLYNNDLNKLINLIDNLVNYGEKKNKYLNEMLYPEIYKYTKIPSLITLPTCSFQLYYTGNFKIKNSNLYFMYSPFFLYNSNFLCPLGDVGTDNQIFYGPNGDIKHYNEMASNPQKKDWTQYYSPIFLSSFSCNNNNSTGVSNNLYWEPININQGIGDLYKKYRLVSACMIIRYVGKQSESRGTIHGGIFFDDNPYINYKGNYIDYTNHEYNEISNNNKDTCDRYMGNYGGKSNLLNNAFYHKENLITEPMKLIYFPVDNSYEQFVDVPNLKDFKYDFIHETAYRESQKYFNLELKNGNRNMFKFLVYIHDAYVGDEDSIKVEIYCNYEGIPNYEYLNYIPTNTNTYNINNKDKKEIIQKLQKKPIIGIDDKDAAPINSYNWENDFKKVYTNN